MLCIRGSGESCAVMSPNGEWVADGRMLRLPVSEDLRQYDEKTYNELWGWTKDALTVKERLTQQMETFTLPKRKRK